MKLFVFAFLFLRSVAAISDAADEEAEAVITATWVIAGLALCCCVMMLTAAFTCAVVALVCPNGVEWKNAAQPLLTSTVVTDGRATVTATAVFPQGYGSSPEDAI